MSCTRSTESAKNVKYNVKVFGFYLPPLYLYLYMKSFSFVCYAYIVDECSLLLLFMRPFSELGKWGGKFFPHFYNKRLLNDSDLDTIALQHRPGNTLGGRRFLRL